MSCLRRYACRLLKSSLIERPLHRVIRFNSCTNGAFIAINARTLHLFVNNCRHLSSSSSLSQRKYTEKHEWIELQPDQKEATVGISDYAQNSLGEIVFVQLPDVGTEVQRGVECGTVESVKAASDIYSPVTGTVSEKNVKVEEKPQLVNKMPLTDGWLFKVELNDVSELNSLLDEDAYKNYLKSVE